MRVPPHSTDASIILDNLRLSEPQIYRYNKDAITVC